MDAQPESSASPATAAPPSTTLPPTKPKAPMKEKPARTLVLCFDGTANQFDGDNTNVVKFYALLKKDCTDEQLCYYQPGIGTYLQPGVVSPFFQWGAKILDEAFAWYLDAHVRGGYQFLMQNWRPGDKICIFGFSRGAYTARALAGMLHKIGLLPKDNPEQIPFAYKLFKKTDSTSLDIAQGFKQTFCRDVTIEFVGVWDTVASVGVITGKSLPFTTSNTTIKTFRHALSLDEHRVKFMPNLYHLPPASLQSARKVRGRLPAPIRIPDEKKRGSKFKATVAKLSPTKSLRRASKRLSSLSGKGDAPQAASDVPSPIVQAPTQEDVTIGTADEPAPSPRAIHVPARKQDDEIEGGTDVLEVWFSGCHSDVGGGAVSDSTEHSLADITLRWMVRQVVLSQCGITFDSAALLRARLPDSVFTGEGFTLSPTPSQRRSRSPRGPASLSVKGTSSLRGASPRPHSADSDSKRRHSLGEARGHSIDERLSSVHPAAGSSSPPAEADPFASPEIKSKVIEEVQIQTLEGGRESVASDGAESAFTDIDEVQPIHDQLKIDWLWWILEIVPLTWSCQDADGNWHQKFGFHLGKGRPIPDETPIFHESVKERMADPTLNYTPRAIWAKNSEIYTT